MLKFSIFAFLICPIVFSAEDSLYNFSWLDKDKEIYVLQNRRYRKSGTVHLSLGGGLTPSGAFINGKNVQARGGFFFSENWGVEGLYSLNSGSENNTAKGVKDQGTIPFYRKPVNYLAGYLLWSPFYSKINTFNSVAYFDWIFGLGAASLTTEDNRNAFPSRANSSALESETNTGLSWTTGLRFYLSQNWAIRLDLSAIHYRAVYFSESNAIEDLSQEQWFHHYDLSLGLNLML